MAEYTQNYSLKKQLGNEYVDVAGLNDNFDIIDTEIGKLNTEKLDKTGDGKDLVTTFTVAITESDFTSSEKDSTKLGKILKSIQTFRAWLSNINSNNASTYSSSSTYVLGKYCLYNNVLYKCTTAITVAEAWTPSHWTATKFGNEIETANNNLALYLNMRTAHIGTRGYNVAFGQNYSGVIRSNTIYIPFKASEVNAALVSISIPGLGSIPIDYKYVGVADYEMYVACDTNGASGLASLPSQVCVVTITLTLK